MQENRSSALPGISAIAVYVPPFKVNLEDWCQWTGNSWEKVSKVTGQSFRMPGPNQNVYTMAANAVLRLIVNNRINPQEIGFLGLGTESSTDNSAGAVIVRGMVDNALSQLGLSKLSRHLEVPEFKHACLGGIYGLKAALRYVAYDGRSQKAIVVSSDIAEYERGSSGEQTQGAGAVAMLVEHDPKLLSIDLHHTGTSSSYRSTDFRKPASRPERKQASAGALRKHDFPVFNGRYSTYAYLDEVAQAVEHMVRRHELTALDFYQKTDGLCFHRPYRQMPLKAVAFLYVRALMQSDHARDQLASLCDQAGIEISQLMAEIQLPEELAAATVENYESDPFPFCNKLADILRARSDFQVWIQEKTGLGENLTRQLGNLYSASLPATLAAMLEDACIQPRRLNNGFLAAIGYGSGDAAEALPLKLCPQWRIAASNIGLHSALQNEIVLSRTAYESLHDHGVLAGIDYLPSNEFVISHIGQCDSSNFQDAGIEYYTYIH